MYRILRLLTIIFFLLQGFADAYILFITLASSIFLPIATQVSRMSLSSLIFLTIVDLSIFLFPILLAAYKLVRDQKLGWQLGIGISLLWLTLQLIVGKSEAFYFPIINLLLSIIGFSLYSKKYL